MNDNIIINFINTFYSNIVSSNFTSIQNYINNDTNIKYQNKSFNSNNFIEHLNKKNINSVKYDLQSYEWLLFSNDKLMIIVNGKLQYCNIYGCKNRMRKFVDIIIINPTNCIISNLYTFLQ